MKTIQATADRKANGWYAVLVFSNGGRQRFQSVYATMEDAVKAANDCLNARLNYPSGCIPDPMPNRLMEV